MNSIMLSEWCGWVCWSRVVRRSILARWFSGSGTAMKLSTPGGHPGRHGLPSGSEASWLPRPGALSCRVGALVAASCPAGRTRDCRGCGTVRGLGSKTPRGKARRENRISCSNCRRDSDSCGHLRRVRCGPGRASRRTGTSAPTVYDTNGGAKDCYADVPSATAYQHGWVCDGRSDGQQVWGCCAVARAAPPGPSRNAPVRNARQATFR